MFGTTRGLDARQRIAGVDLVDHHLEVQRVAAIGVGGSRVVAHHAVLHLDAGAAVRAQLRMTVVAGRGLDDLAAEDAGGGTGRRLEGVGGVVRLRETADFEAYAMGQRRVIDDVRIFRDVFLERVLIGAVAVVDQRAAGGGFGRGLRLGVVSQADTPAGHPFGCRRSDRYTNSIGSPCRSDPGRACAMAKPRSAAGRPFKGTPF